MVKNYGGIADMFIAHSEIFWNTWSTAFATVGALL